MTEEQIKKRINTQTMALNILNDEYSWRMRDLLSLQVQLNKLDRLVIFCQTGKYPD